VLIKVGGDESKDAARERHYRDHPEDRGADREIFLTIVDPKRGGGTDGHKISAPTLFSAKSNGPNVDNQRKVGRWLKR